MQERKGQRLGNYHLLRRLGEGAFADVYLGEHLYLKDYAAIKILRSSLDEEDEQLFLSEAQTIAKLTHPNIVRVREFAVERATPFLVMDYAPGGTLRDRYSGGTCLSLETTVDYVKQVASALQYAHNRDIIHRDVKPENMLQSSEHIMLSDFGISIYALSPTNLNVQQNGGTIPYMAPEQFVGQAVFASDQYALAIVAYEWLCGVRPFTGSPKNITYLHRDVPPPPLREKDPSLPEAVEAVILKALSKKPEERYVSVTNFARALERASCRDSSYEIQAVAATEMLYHTPSRNIFLSHTTSDEVTHLQADLSERGFFVQNNATSKVQEEKTRQAIRAAQFVLLVLTPHTRLSVAVQEHLRLAAFYRRSILCVWTQGDDLQALLPSEAKHATILDARGPRYQQVLDEIVKFLGHEQQGVIQRENSSPELGLEPRNPYKGLRAFTQHDRADFFGRTSLIQEMLFQLDEALHPIPTDGPKGRFLAVVGPSGSGKSSAMMAGFLPQLQDGALAGSEQWIYLDPLMPCKQPLESLTQLLVTRFPEQDPLMLRETLGQEGGFGLHQLGLTLVSQPQHIVLMIDQFEELFSSHLPEPELSHFIELLVRSATEPYGPFIILLTLRADFYDRPLAYPTLGRLIQQQQCPVLSMSVEDLREVIERPALLPDVGLTFDEDLVGDLLFDMRGQVGALPLLSFALDQLFDHRRGRRLTRNAYQDMGGLHGALSKQAEATYEALPSEGHRRLVRVLFMRLIQLGAPGQEPLRRRAMLAEFELADPLEKRRIRETLEAFIKAHMLTTSQNLGTITVEVSHEAVLRKWPRLAVWLDEAREEFRIQQGLSEDVAAWEQRKRPRDRLYRGAQLKEAQVWAKHNRPNAQEAAFLHASARRRIFSFLIMMILALLLISPTGAVGWFLLNRPQPTLVTTLQDKGVGSLRWCVQNASTGSTIRFAPNMKGTIKLTGGDLIFAGKRLTIIGPGAQQLAISGGNVNAIFHISQNASLQVSGLSFKDSQTINEAFLYNEGTLTMSNSIVANNKSSSGATILGGGIYNRGILNINNSTISGNVASHDGASGGGYAQGGGIQNSQTGKLTITKSTIIGNKVFDGNDQALGGGISNGGGMVTLIDSTISQNTADSPDDEAHGGGIFNLDSGKMIISNSAVSNNTATSSGDDSKGGGIYNKGAMMISDTTISNSTATSTSAESRGGGIYNQGKLTMLNSTLSGNKVADTGTASFGGGIYNNSGGTLTVANSTIFNNTASSATDVAQGGGIANEGALTVIASTIVGNTISTQSIDVAVQGGGIYNDGTSNNVSLSIIAANKAPQGPDIAGALTSSGYNLLEDITGASGLATTDQQVTPADLKLDLTLRNNGGPTQTLALLPGSVAIDVIPAKVCSFTITNIVTGATERITADQRGHARPDGGENMCDVGAYESID